MALCFVCNSNIHKPQCRYRPEYEQRLTGEGKWFLSGYNTLNFLSDIRDFEAPVFNFIESIIPSMSSDSFQGMAFLGL